MNILAHSSDKGTFRLAGRGFFLLIFSLLLVSCAPPPKFLGSNQPLYAINACPINDEFCTIQISKDEWKIIGTYYLDKTSRSNYLLHGSIKLDVSKVSPILQSVSRLQLVFIFFQDDLVVHEEQLRLKGKANEYIKFSQSFETESDIDSSTLAMAGFRATELPSY